MIVGLTGGIGSGKSTVSRLFELLGCAVFHSDEVAKEIYFDTAVKPKIIELLGKESYISETRINKPFISSKVFSNTNLLHELNAIIHPAVLARTALFKEENRGKLVIKETALLFEAHLEKEVDKIIVVTASDALRIRRVMERDGLREEEVRNKMKSQLPQEDKIKKADFIIDNNENELVIPRVIEIYNTLRKEMERHA
jgi:dephospho-CoA kinase